MVLAGKSCTVLFWERESLTFVKGDHQNTGLRRLDHRGLRQILGCCGCLQCQQSFSIRQTYSKPVRASAGGMAPPATVGPLSSFSVMVGVEVERENGLRVLRCVSLSSRKWYVSWGFYVVKGGYFLDPSLLDRYPTQEYTKTYFLLASTTCRRCTTQPRSREGFVGVAVTRVTGVEAHQLADGYLASRATFERSSEACGRLEVNVCRIGEKGFKETGC